MAITVKDGRKRALAGCRLNMRGVFFLLSLSVLTKFIVRSFRSGKVRNEIFYATILFKVCLNMSGCVSQMR